MAMHVYSQSPHPVLYIVGKYNGGNNAVYIAGNFRGAKLIFVVLSSDHEYLPTNEATLPTFTCSTCIYKQQRRKYYP